MARDLQRSREQQAARQQAAAAAARAARNRRLVAGGVLVAVALATIGAVIAATSEDDGNDGNDTVATPTSTTVAAGGSTVDVPRPAPGAAIEGAPPCPPTDGSAERTTSFDTAPPLCLATTDDGAVDLDVIYRATVTTSAGDMEFLLDTERSPQAVNSFVTLARYHYWDGVPVDTALRSAWAEMGGEFEGDTAGATYTLPTETPEVGSIPVPGFLAASPVTEDGGLTNHGGRLVMVLGENGAALPVRTTYFALLLDGTEAFAAINRAATDSGQPSQVITIENVVITEELGHV